MFDFVYHTAHDVLHVNCEKPRAYFIPYESEKKALADNRADNANFISLCGEWDFKFYPTPENIEDFLSAKVNMQCWVKVKEDWRDSNYILNDFGFTEE